MSTRQWDKASVSGTPRLLLLDDDDAFLKLYHEMLSKHLTCMPEVKTANSGVRALSMLEAEPFTLLIVDLNMPKMDGLQVLSVARRKYPQTRLVVLTGVRNEQFRTRAYAMGVDQYWVKPESDQELGLFIESIDSLLQREAQGGFRGVQSKSLVDIIQLECLSQSSCLLKISNGLMDGKIWIQNGEVVDAAAGERTAEPAFQRILSWKTGSFEILSADPNRTRTIFTSYQGLLLNTVHALDEAASQQPGANAVEGNVAPGLLAQTSQVPGVELVLAMGTGSMAGSECWGLDNPGPVAEWVQDTLNRFQTLSDKLQVGPVQQIIAAGPHRKLAISPCGEGFLCLGFAPATPADQLLSAMKQVLSTWVS